MGTRFAKRGVAPRVSAEYPRGGRGVAATRPLEGRGKDAARPARFFAFSERTIKWLKPFSDASAQICWTVKWRRG